MSSTWVAVDLGASGTRVTSKELMRGTTDISIIAVSNHMYFISPEEEDDVKPQMSGDSMLDNLNVTIEKISGESKHFPVHLLAGQMAESSFNSRMLSIPDTEKQKHSQRINYISAILSTAVVTAHKNIQDGKITLYVAVPPSEIDMSEEVMPAELKGTFKVTFHGLNAETQFEIVDVVMCPESMMVMMSQTLTLELRVKSDAMSLINASKMALSIDIGASTTDLAIMKGSRYQNHSGETFRVGGNSVKELVRKGLYKANLTPRITDEAVMQRIIEEGTIQRGNKFIPITDIMERAKDQVAKEIANEIIKYFSLSQDYTMFDMNAIVVSGGGSMASKYIDENNEEKVTSRPLSDFIYKYLKEHYEDIDIDVFNSNCVSPRFANITGLAVKALMDEKVAADRAAKEAQAAQAAQSGQI